MVNSKLRPSLALAPLALAGVLLLAACGGDDVATGGSSKATNLPDDTCAQLDLVPLLKKHLGGEPAVLSEGVTEKDGTITAQCVWSVPAAAISAGGAIVEVVVQTAPRGELDALWESNEALDVAPSDWRPATRIETTTASPAGDWESAAGTDYVHPHADAGTIRMLSFRAVEGDDYVARVEVRMDAKRAGSPAPAKVANQALAAVPGIFD